MKNASTIMSSSANELSPAESMRLTVTAYHEAGHAVMAISLGRLIQKVTIVPGKSQFGESRLGICELRNGRSKASKDKIEDQVLILLAGMVAEAQLTGQYCQQGASSDLLLTRRMLQNRANSESQLERLQRRMLNKTEHMLRDEVHAKAIRLIANELVEKSTISGRAVRHFFQQARHCSST